MGAPCLGPRLVLLSTHQPMLYWGATYADAAIKATAPGDLAKVMQIGQNLFQTIMKDGRCLIKTALELWQSSQKCFEGQTIVDKTCNIFHPNATFYKVCQTVSKNVADPIVDTVREALPEEGLFFSQEGLVMNGRCHYERFLAGNFFATCAMYYGVPLAAIGIPLGSYIVYKSYKPLKLALSAVGQGVSLGTHAIVSVASAVLGKLKRAPSKIELVAQKVEKVEKGLSVLAFIKKIQSYEYQGQWISRYEILGNLNAHVSRFQKMGFKVRIVHHEGDDVKMFELRMINGARLMFSQMKAKEV